MAPAPVARLGESLLATGAVAGALIAVVYSVRPVTTAVRRAPWIAGPALWVLTALGAATVLRSLPGRDYAAAAVVVATAVGGSADALVVARGRPWPGLAVGVWVFSVAMALLGGPRRAGHGAVGDETP